MKLAVLGTDADVLRLITAARSRGHQIIWLGDVRPTDSHAIDSLSLGLIDQAPEWETLLDHRTADAVLVGRGADDDDLRSEQLKRLAAEAVPLLIVHPITASVLPYYELDMVRRETGGIVRHFNPQTGHPVLGEMAQWVVNGHPQIGAVHQIACERRTADNSPGAVIRCLARDAEMLILMAGDVRHVSAAGPRDTDATFAALQVQMTPTEPASVRWSVGPQHEIAENVEVRLVGERGSVTLYVADSAADPAVAWQLETAGTGVKTKVPLPSFDPPLAAIDQLAGAVNDSDPARNAAASTWEKATRAMEVLDAVELSLQKHRTIEVHQQQLTEQTAFRGTMAAMGCGLLLIGFAVILFVTLLGGAEGVGRQPLIPAWPLVLLAVLAFFLLLQAVPLLASKKGQRDSNKHGERT